MIESPEEFLDEEPELYEQDGPGLFDDPDAMTADTAGRTPTAGDSVGHDPAAPAGIGKSDADASIPPGANTPRTSHPKQTPPAPSAGANDLVTSPQGGQSPRPEAPLALYRRYRPETFDEVIGQGHVTEPLQRALTNNKVNHAYLFSGPRGCGKTTSARILARALNCVQGPTPVPCGVCDSCVGLGRGGSGTVDVIEIDAASHGGVNEARDLRERAFFSPVASRYKIYIIDEAHMVTKEGFNALLKVVEEPPPHVKFIFATTEPDKVLGTIRSRTHHYPFRLVPPPVLGAYLTEVCDREGVAIGDDVIPLVVRAGGGSVRDSLSVLDQLLGGASSEGVTYQQATGLLGFTPDSLLDETVDAISAGDAAGVFAAVGKVMDAGQDPRRFAEDLLHRMRDLLIVSAVPEAVSNGLIAVSADQAERLTTQAAGLGRGELTRAGEVIASGLTEMRGTTAPRLHLELMLARVLLPGADLNDRGVHARLDRLERRLAMPGGAPVGAPAAVPAAVAAPEPDQRARVRPVPSPADTTSPPEAPAARRSEHDEEPRRPDSDATRRRPTSDDPAPVRPNGRDDDGSTRRPRPVGKPAASAEGPAKVVPLDSRRNQPEPAAPPTPAPAATGALSTAGLRDRWPEVLAEVKKRRRFTWILLSQNAQVAEVRDGVLSLDISNVGARDSFGRGGSDQVLRDALVEVLGVDLKVTVGGQAAPVAEPAPAPSPAPKPARSEAAAAVRTAIAEARASAETATSPDQVTEEDLNPNDIDVDDEMPTSDELLTSQLGAQFIGEEDATE